jgi:hypothetical protein
MRGVLRRKGFGVYSGWVGPDHEDAMPPVIAAMRRKKLLLLLTEA